MPMDLKRNMSPSLLLLSSYEVVSDSLRPMNSSMLSSSILQYLLEFAEIHVHWVGGAV